MNTITIIGLMGIGALLGWLYFRERNIRKRFQKSFETCHAKLRSRISRQVVALEQKIAEHRQVDDVLRSREGMLQAMSEAAHDAMIIIDSNDRIVFWNCAAEKMFGYSKAEALRQKFHPLVTLDEDCRQALQGMKTFAKTGTGPVMNTVMEFVAIRKNGERFPVERSVAAFQVEGKWYAVGGLRDITERKKYEERLQRMATTDGLTGVFNRRHFMGLAAIEFERARRHARSLSLLMIDADHFKLINDTYGHDIGDKVLQHLTTVTAAELRKIDILGRLGGEEFVVLLPDTGLAQAVGAAERLRKTLEHTEVETPEEPVRFTVSIGVACMTRSMETVGDVLKSADKALYSAKEGGRNRVAAMPPADDCV